MRPLPVCVVLAGLLALPAAASEPIEIEARPIEDFGLTGSNLEDGPLTFLGGLHLTSSDRRFGGFSGIDFAADGSLFIVSDAGRYVSGRLAHDGARPTGLAEAEIGSVFPEAERSKQDSDIEDVAFDPADAGRGAMVLERQAQALRSFRHGDGGIADVAMVPVSAKPRLLHSNKGLESVAYAPAGSHLAERIVVIAERSYKGRSETIPGWIVGAGSFEIVRSDNFDVSSARFLPNGDLLLLERRYAPAWGIAMRLRRIPGELIQVGAQLDGDILMEAGMTYQIDNMEGLAVHQDATGRIILTIVSDNNFSILQRTLLLQFALE